MLAALTTNFVSPGSDTTRIRQTEQSLDGRPVQSTGRNTNILCWCKCRAKECVVEEKSLASFANHYYCCGNVAARGTCGFFLWANEAEANLWTDTGVYKERIKTDPVVEMDRGREEGTRWRENDFVDVWSTSRRGKPYKTSNPIAIPPARKWETYSLYPGDGGWRRRFETFPIEKKKEATRRSTVDDLSILDYASSASSFELHPPTQTTSYQNSLFCFEELE